VSETLRWQIEGQDFECDPVKSERTYKARGFDFGYASLAYFDASAIVANNSVDPRTGEERFQCIGCVEDNLLVVVYCVRTLKHDKESIRILSARYAETEEEVASYRDQ
jgi:uncharacterized DUF497 family protein